MRRAFALHLCCDYLRVSEIVQHHSSPHLATPAQRAITVVVELPASTMSLSPAPLSLASAATRASRKYLDGLGMFVCAAQDVEPHTWHSHVIESSYLSSLI